MDDETGIADHYSNGTLLAAIERGLETMGVTPETVSVDHLGPVDEFHIGGRAATAELCEHLGATSESELLDIGCGIGGTARFIASTIGCHVTGIDLTAEYIEVARTLTDWTSLGDRVDFELGSALDMPFADESFDGATQIHVGMNIADKAALFREIHRVLRPGSTFALYDIMKMSDGDVDFPVPWATDASTSFVTDLSTHRRELEAAGFDVRMERDRRGLAIEFFKAIGEKTASAGGPPPLGLHVIFGSDAPEKVANMVAAVTAGMLAPVEVICQRP
jgi:SAM-dependent methyltransferase